MTLQNRFVNLLLLVGLDESTGLICEGDKKWESNIDSIFTQKCQPEVLAAVNPKTTMICFPFSHEEQNVCLRGSITDQLPVDQRLHRSLSYNTRYRRMSLAVTKGTCQSSKVNWTMTEEDTKRITIFCFPDDIVVKKSPPQDTVHFLVLTDIKYTKTYATCLTFYQQYVATKQFQGKVSLKLYAKKPALLKENQCLCYVPMCCVLISPSPYFCTLKECLSMAVQQIKEEPEEKILIVKRLMHKLGHTPIPPPGSVAVGVKLHQRLIVVHPPVSSCRPVMDIPLHLVFLCFPIDVILKIITCILTEEQIIFLSSSYGLLTIIMESFCNLILPFTWCHTYVPLITSQCLELVEAPCSFMMGCHSKHEDDIRQVENLIVVNIDDGTLSVSEADQTVRTDSGFLHLGKNIPLIPRESAELFKAMYKKVKFQFDLLEIERPTSFNAIEEKEFKDKKIRAFNSQIMQGALELLVNLFRDVVAVSRIDLKRFNKQHFLQLQLPEEQPFYEKVLETDIFKQFLQDRLDEKDDYWSDMELKTRSSAKKSRLRSSSFVKQASLTIFPCDTDAKELVIFELPSINEVPSYLQKCVGICTDKLKDCRHVSERESYLYLRGMFNWAREENLMAFDDLASLHTAHAHLFPAVMVRQVYMKLSEVEKQKLLKKKKFHHMSDILQSEEAYIDNHQHRSITESVRIPEKDIEYEEFLELLSLLDISHDYDARCKLFQSLTNFENQQTVDQVTFEIFYDCWLRNLAQCHDIDITSGMLLPDEDVLKVSALIKSDYGTGRMVLTSRRLFFLKDISNQYREIFKLRNIKSLQKYQQYSLFTTVDVLIIDGKVQSKQIPQDPTVNTSTHMQGCQDGTSFTACLKTNRNLWYLLITEMLAGKIYADGNKYLGAIELAVQNVLMLDALIHSGRKECCAHHGNIEAAAANLCYFTRCHYDNKHKLPEETSGILQNKINPNIGLKIQQAVQAILLMPGDEGGKFSQKVWCAMGDGKVRVIDGVNWTLESKYVQACNTVTCLFSPDQRQIWAGSYDIYIIDTETISYNKKLTEHEDLVTAILQAEEPGFVYTASLDGIIYKWEVMTLTKVKTYHVKNAKILRAVQLHDGKLWCCSKKGLSSLALDTGEVLQTISFIDGEKHEDWQRYFDCFQILSTGEVWIGLGKTGKISIWDTKSFEFKKTVTLDYNGVKPRGISAMVVVEDKLWVATKTGTIHIYGIANGELLYVLQAHDDAIRSIYNAENRYVFSGAGSGDGTIAIWSVQLPQATMAGTQV